MEQSNKEELIKLLTNVLQKHTQEQIATGKLKNLKYVKFNQTKLKRTL